MKLLCGEDQPLMRLGLRQALLGSSAELVGIARALDELLASACEHRPDVVLVNHRLLRPDAPAVVAAIAQHAGAVLILAERDRLQRTFPLVAAGAAGVVRSEADAGELRTCVARAAAGHVVLHETMEQPFYETTRRPHQRLSPRELEVLVLVGRGASNPAIAAALHLGMGTVKQHLERAFAKLRVSDRSAAVLRAVQLGWIDAEALQLDAV